ncbi:MAG: cyclase family protein [Actinomycetia bacterium]|nr:cyclase family protein [Actinomycetes bacterium]
MPVYFDISPTLGPKTPAWPTDPPVRFEGFKELDHGGSSNVLKLTLGTHAGSHIDAPLHFFPGRASVDKLPLDVLIGEVTVVEISGDQIDREALESALSQKDVTRVLFKTKNSAFWKREEFVRDFAGLTADAAAYLVQRKCKLVGIDYLSIEAAHSEGAPAHQELLGNNVVIVESLNLSGVDAGLYELICLPLKLQGADGAPARVVLRK